MMDFLKKIFAVEDSRKKMKMAEAKMLQLTKKSFQFRTLNSSIHLKLDQLRNKILRAKQAASSVSRSLLFFSFSFFAPPSHCQDQDRDQDRDKDRDNGRD